MATLINGTNFDDLIDINWPGRSNPDGAEIISGRKGNDNIFGLGGNDSIDGGPGDDTINGGLGNDTYAGGAGSDRYVYDPDGGLDRIVETKNQPDVTDLVLLTGTHVDIGWDFDGNDLLIGGVGADYGNMDPANQLRIVGQYRSGRRRY